MLYKRSVAAQTSKSSQKVNSSFANSTFPVSLGIIKPLPLAALSLLQMQMSKINPIKVHARIRLCFTAASRLFIRLASFVSARENLSPADGIRHHKG